MQQIGTIGNASNPAGTIYQTKKGNYIDAPSVDGRKTYIKENKDGTYNVTITKDGETTYNKTLSEKQLVKEFGADINTLDINLNGSDTAQQAKNKYGSSVANNLYKVV